MSGNSLNIEDLRLRLANESMPKRLRCPWADLKEKPDYSRAVKCAFHKIKHNEPPQSQAADNFAGDDTSDILKDLGGGDRIREMTTRFYAHAFRDQTLVKFMVEEDGAAAFGKRLGDFIVEIMGGEGCPWSESGRRGMRGPSHRASWYSPYRDDDQYGDTFQLDDCRIWMRLMFLAAREVGLDKHEPFWDWYRRFIKGFIRIYEYTAPPYAFRDAEWSAKEENIKQYAENNYIMSDVVRIGRH